MSTAVTMPPVEDQPSKSFLQRFIGVFVSPGDAFADIVRKPDWIAPLVVVIIMSMAVTEVMLAKIGIERIIRNSIEQSSRASQMSAEQMQQAVSQGAKFAGPITHVAGLLGPLIGMIVIAAIGMLIVSSIFGGSVKFKTAFSVTCYASLIGVLSSLMMIAMIFFGDPEHFNPDSAMPTNLGFFLDPQTTSKPLMALAGRLDIFSFWTMALLGIAFAKAGSSEADRRRLKPLSVFLTFLGLWVIYVLIRMGLATLGS